MRSVEERSVVAAGLLKRRCEDMLYRGQGRLKYRAKRAADAAEEKSVRGESKGGTKRGKSFYATDGRTSESWRGCRQNRVLRRQWTMYSS